MPCIVLLSIFAVVFADVTGVGIMDIHVEIYA